MIWQEDVIRQHCHCERRAKQSRREKLSHCLAETVQSFPILIEIASSSDSSQ